MSDDQDREKKIEEVETGYRMTIKSKRGTGTRDEDTVTITAKTETLEKLNQQAPALEASVTATMENRRNHQPDQEQEGEQ